jgi:hypothetical protein
MCNLLKVVTLWQKSSTKLHMIIFWLGMSNQKMIPNVTIPNVIFPNRDWRNIPENVLIPK